MGTATSRGPLAAIVASAVAIALAVAGCGGTGGGSTVRSQAAGSAAPAARSFAWLRPGPPPNAGWSVASILTGATLPYPDGWERVPGDRGTATVELVGTRDQTLGYLNVTPRQGDETLTNWTHFRVDHNAEEGDKSVKTMASASGLRFRDGRGSCVQDSYTTGTGARYIELACLVAGKRATSVVVGAAPPQAWSAVAPQLERAISGVTT
jgi:hypothetical protein